MKEVAAELEQWLATGEPVAIATVVRISGSYPLFAAARFMVLLEMVEGL